MNDRFTRIKWLVGEEKFQKISQTKVLVCGLGGVGGICVDALYRSGFKNLTLIDADKFEITNQNRQIHSENCRRKNKISIWKNKTSIKVEILFFYKP